MGIEIYARVDWYRNGLLSAWLPLKQATNLASAAGVSAVQLAQHFNASVTGSGVTASQGRVVHKTQGLNALGYDGSAPGGGQIAVGALSDSYNKLGTAYSVHAADGVAAGDLPGAGNPDGHITPVQVIQDASGVLQSKTDEGRGMLEIVHDLVPAARLAFATANNTQANFANNILALAAPVGTTTSAGKAGAGCNVICDDVGYFAEPMFSDGVIAQAIETVNAQGVSYFPARE